MDDLGTDLVHVRMEQFHVLAGASSEANVVQPTRS
jgi:hypothetical protein